MAEKKEITIEIRKPELIAVLVFAAIVLAMELNVTLNTPISFGDEAFHVRLGQLIAQESDYFGFMPFEVTTLIRQGFERPPLWNLLIAGFSIFGFQEMLVKSLTPFIAVMTGIAVFLLTRRLLDEKVAMVAAIITMIIPSFVTYSVLFYTDALLTFYTALAVLLFAVAMKEDNRKYMILSAVFAAMAFLTKKPGVAVIGFFAVVLLYELLTQRKLLLVKKYGIVFLVFLAVVSGFLVRNYSLYGTPMCFNLPFISIFDTGGCSTNEVRSVHSFGGRTLETGTEQSIYSIGLVNYLIFAYGNVWFVVLGAAAGFLLLIWKRDKFVNMLMLYFLFFLLLFLVPTVVYRAEDAARLTLSWVFLFGIMAATFFAEIHHFLSKYNKYVAVVVFIVVLIFSYQSLASKLASLEGVKRFSPAFFEACDWVKDNLPQDATLYDIWSHRSVYNCQRNAVGPVGVPDIELSLDVNVSVKAAKDNGIDHIFIEKFSIDPQNRNLMEMYNLNFVQFMDSSPDVFVKVFESGPPVDECMQKGGCDGVVIYQINFTDF